MADCAVMIDFSPSRGAMRRGCELRGYIGMAFVYCARGVMQYLRGVPVEKSIVIFPSSLTPYTYHGVRIECGDGEYGFRIRIEL